MFLFGNFISLFHLTKMLQVNQTGHCSTNFHRFLTGFRSGHGLGHSKTLIIIFFNLFLRPFCALGHWKTILCFMFRCLIEACCFCVKLDRSSDPSEISILTPVPVTAEDKPPYNVMLPPLCFTGSMVGFSVCFWSHLLELHLYILPQHILPHALG